MRTHDGKHVRISITQDPIPIVEDNPDEMKVVIRCPYCGRKSTYGETVMISGFVGCNHCYWDAGGMLNTVLWLLEYDYDAYIDRSFYKEGYEVNKRLWEERKKNNDS